MGDRNPGNLGASLEVLFFARSYSVLYEDLVPDSAVAVKGRVNWREDKMSVFGSGVVPLNLGDAEHHPATLPPFVLRAETTKINTEVAVELRGTLTAHKGDTPVHLLLCHEGRETALVLDGFPVKVGSAPVGELRAILGITVAS